MSENKYLIVLDRETGEKERIAVYDGNYTASIASAAEKNGMTFRMANEIIQNGGVLRTAGFDRYLEHAQRT